MTAGGVRPVSRVLVLIGPMHAGKSTVAGLVAGRLGVRRVAMDEVRWEYYAEIGYDEGRAQEIAGREGFEGLYRYWKPFEAHAVERLIADVAGERCVVDFGAGHSVYEDERLFERVRAALRPCRVVLLLPSSDEGESVRILTERRDAAYPEMAGRPAGMNEHFVRHPSNRRLADVVVYTGGRTPEETTEEVVRVAG